MKSPNFDAIEDLPSDCILSPDAAAQYLGCTGQAVRARIKHGTLPATKVGSRYWIKGANLKAMVLPVIN